MNLKKILMELGNKLVLDRGFEPSGPVPETLRDALSRDDSTRPITVFTEWLNLHPEAREVLEDMGVRWPM